MKFRIIINCLIWLMLSSQTAAQPQPPQPNLTIVKRQGIFPVRTRQTKEQKKRLLPDARDLRNYEQLLRQAGTGIFRLLPDRGCYENMNVVRADETCLNSIPESSYYSFREKEHTIETLSDIRLQNGYLISDGILSQGMMVSLGAVGLEEVTPASDGLKFLQNYLPPSSAVEVQKHYFQVVNGIRIERHEYRKSLRAEENTTYAMRVIAYRGSIFRSFRGFRYDLLQGDKRIDLTLAFRIIRKETDGSLTIVWRELVRRDAPKILFPKRKDRR